MQDGPLYHRAKKIAKWLKEVDIRFFYWPDNSMDINPIKNCWNCMKECFAIYDIYSVPQLTDEIKKLWTAEISLYFFLGTC